MAKKSKADQILEDYKTGRISDKNYQATSNAPGIYSSAALDQAARDFVSAHPREMLGYATRNLNRDSVSNLSRNAMNSLVGGGPFLGSAPRTNAPQLPRSTVDTWSQRNSMDKLYDAAHTLVQNPTARKPYPLTQQDAMELQKIDRNLDFLKGYNQTVQNPGYPAARCQF